MGRLSSSLRLAPCFTLGSDVVLDCLIDIFPLSPRAERSGPQIGISNSRANSIFTWKLIWVSFGGGLVYDIQSTRDHSTHAADENNELLQQAVKLVVE